MESSRLFKVTTLDWSKLKNTLNELSPFLKEGGDGILREVAGQMKQIEDKVLDDIDKREEKKTICMERRKVRVYEKLLYSFEEDCALDTYDENSHTKDGILKNINALREKLQSKRSVDVACRISDLIQNLGLFYKKKKELNKILMEATSWSQSYVNFIMDIGHFCGCYKKMKKSILPLCWFKANFRIIKDIFLDLNEEQLLNFK